MSLKYRYLLGMTKNYMICLPSGLYAAPQETAPPAEPEGPPGATGGTELCSTSAD